MLPPLGVAPHPPSNIGDISRDFEQISAKFSANLSTDEGNQL